MFILCVCVCVLLALCNINIYINARYQYIDVQLFLVFQKQKIIGSSHCTFCLCPSADTPNSSLAVSTNELLGWISCARWGTHTKCAVVGRTGLRSTGVQDKTLVTSMSSHQNSTVVTSGRPH